MARAGDTDQHDDGSGPVNQVRLRGRLAAAAVERALPSGDVVATFRLVVDRPARSGSGSSARVDTLDCAVFTSTCRRRIARWHPGDVIEVEGSLRRRFFRTGAARPRGTRSRCRR